MRIAITGGAGFVGRHLAEHLLRLGHEVVLVTRGRGHRPASGVPAGRGTTVAAVGLDDVDALAGAFAGCQAVAHCAGINREIGSQTYQRVHVEGTRNVVAAARRAGVRRMAILSFLRARPDCGSPYHESKFAAEEIVQRSGLQYTVFKSGVIYGQGDHMLDHLSHALHTFPVFALVGMRDKPVRPIAVEDMAGLFAAALVDGELRDKTVAVLGPEEMPLGEAVRRVADAVGRHPWMIRLPVVFHRVLACVAEWTMRVPLVSRAQVRILAEGVAEPLPGCEMLPTGLQPQRRFTQEQIKRGLPPAGPFGLGDCRWWARLLPQ